MVKNSTTILINKGCAQAKKTRLKNKNLHKSLTLLTSVVWLANGLFCKLLNLVPRHEQIVARILGENYSRPLIILIGLSEVVMAAWVLSKFKSKLNAITQILLVVVMNTLEFILVPDLLLWGRLNSLYALLFIGLVYYNEFVLNKNITQQTA